MGVVLVVGAALAFGYFEVHTAFIEQRVSEGFDADGMTLVARGDFHDVVHKARGHAELYRSQDGAHHLRFTDFRVDNGPTLFLRLVALPDAHDSASVAAAEHVDLGPLKGNAGDQAYALPSSFDPGKHASVVVWCERFGVNFAVAPLAKVAANVAE